MGAGEVISLHSPENNRKDDLRHSSSKFLAASFPVPFSLADLLPSSSKTLLVGSRLSEDTSLPLLFSHFPGLLPDTQISPQWSGQIHSCLSRLLSADVAQGSNLLPRDPSKLPGRYPDIHQRDPEMN